MTGGLARIRARLSGGGGLGARAARAGLWGMVDLGAGNLLRLLGNLVMTRLLVPEAFGLMAMVVVVHTALVMFTDLGINQSVVRSPRGDAPRFLRVAWTVQVGRSLAIAALVVAAAGLLALLAPGFAPPGSVYADPVLPALIAVSALMVVLKGLESTNVWLADRRLQLARLALVNLAGQAAGLAAMIGFALLEPTVWALLWGGLVGSALTAALTHLVFAGPRMALLWDREIGDELWRFGRNILGASALGFFANNADRLILGALLGARDFGFYVIALTWALLFVSVVEKLAGQVGLATLSETTRERPAEVGRVYGRLSGAVDAVCAVSFLACLLGGPILIDLLYPADYAASAAFVPLLAVMILARRFVPLTGLLLSRGDSRALLHVTAIRAAAALAALPLGNLAFGVPGAVVASALTQLFGAPYLVWRARDLLGRAGLRRETLWIAAILGVAVSTLFIFGGL
jgi:O-antigen/teichoic acid export membrane protein